MTEKRYYQKRYGDEFYIIDSNVISEKEFDEKLELQGYKAFEDSLTGDEVVELLNEQNKAIDELITVDSDWEVKARQRMNELEKENEQLKKVFRELITSGYWDDDYLTEQDWNDLKRWIENVFEKVMMND